MPEKIRTQRKFSQLMLAVAMSALFVGCSTPERLDAVPDAREFDAVVIADAKDIRFIPGEETDKFFRIGIQSVLREAKHLKVEIDDLPPLIILAVSGGGDNGAFGAGLLTGWTKAGTRPQFKAVTGISTGALIAPFAFLGEEFDPQLTEVFTTMSQEDIFTPRGLIQGMFGDAMADTTPLFNVIKNFANREMLDRIAEEYRKGRLLLIATTNLDEQKPVIWNIGAIAQSQDPKAVEVFQKVLLASAAIPAMFPPVLFEVEVDGKKYHEMHVDGGAVAQTFVYPPGANIAELARSLQITRERRLYLIRNARLDLNWANTERATMSIAGRAISSLINSQGIGDLFQIYTVTQRDGFDYNLAFIPPEFDLRPKEQFDNAFMRALFDFAHERAKAGYPWQKLPPGLSE